MRWSGDAAGTSVVTARDRKSGELSPKRVLPTAFGIALEDVGRAALGRAVGSGSASTPRASDASPRAPTASVGRSTGVLPDRRSRGGAGPAAIGAQKRGAVGVAECLRDVHRVSCTASTQCVDADPCTVGTCIARVCVVTVFDADGDTFPSIACGGTDCDDTNEAMHPGRPAGECIPR